MKNRYQDDILRTLLFSDSSADEEKSWESLEESGRAYPAFVYVAP